MYIIYPLQIFITILIQCNNAKNINIKEIYKSKY